MSIKFFFLKSAGWSWPFQNLSISLRRRVLYDKDIEVYEYNRDRENY